MIGYAQFNEAVSEFMAGHPQQDGWKCYHMDDGAIRRTDLQWAVSYLQHRHPHMLKGCSHVIIRPFNDVLDGLIETRSYPLARPWNGCEDLDGSWTGHLEFDWEGQPLHFRLLTAIEYHRLLLVATKSIAAFQSFLVALRRYVKEREAERGQVIVINGENIPRPSASWNDLCLSEGIADAIRIDVEGFFASRCRYESLSIPFRRGLLFAGPPGTGKTSTIRVLASTVKATCVVLTPSAETDHYDINLLFRIASNHAPSLAVIEDLDRFLEGRLGRLSHLLNLLDGITGQNLQGVLFIATANKLQALDPALLHRPGRFHKVYRFGLPQYEESLSLLRKHGAKHFSDAALHEAARLAKGLSHAYLVEVIVNTLLRAAHANREPTDQDLLVSLDTLKIQRKSTDKENADLFNVQKVGFHMSAWNE